MLVLGQHNSGTSMLARLMMLMGAFQGNVKGMSIVNNRNCILLHYEVVHAFSSSRKMVEQEHMSCGLQD